MHSALPCAHTEALLEAEPGPRFLQKPPTHRGSTRAGTPVPSTPPPPPVTDLSRVPFGGARRPHGPARTLGAAKPRRGGRGRGRRTPGRPRSGAAEAAVATSGSGDGPGELPEPTTSRLPWFALRAPRAVPPHGPPVGCNPCHSGRVAYPLAMRSPLSFGVNCPLVGMVVIPSSVI